MNQKLASTHDYFYKVDDVDKPNNELKTKKHKKIKNSDNNVSLDGRLNTKGNMNKVVKVHYGNWFMIYVNCRKTIFYFFVFAPWTKTHIFWQCRMNERYHATIDYPGKNYFFDQKSKWEKFYSW